LIAIHHGFFPALRARLDVKGALSTYFIEYQYVNLTFNPNLFYNSFALFESAWIMNGNVSADIGHNSLPAQQSHQPGELYFPI